MWDKIRVYTVLGVARTVLGVTGYSVTAGRLSTNAAVTGCE